MDLPIIKLYMIKHERLDWLRVEVKYNEQIITILRSFNAKWSSSLRCWLTEVANLDQLQKAFSGIALVTGLENYVVKIIPDHYEPCKKAMTEKLTVRRYSDSTKKNLLTSIWRLHETLQ